MTYFIGKTFLQDYNTSFNACYKLIKQCNELPSLEKIFSTIKKSRDMLVAANSINLLYANALKRALLSELQSPQARRLSPLITVEITVDQKEITTKGVKITYADIELVNPNYADLINLQVILTKQGKSMWFNGVDFPQTVSIYVTQAIIEQIKQVVEEGICEPTLDSSGGNSLTIIIELGFIADMALTNSNFSEYFQYIWQVLEGHKEELADLKKLSPSFIVLYASLNDKE